MAQSELIDAIARHERELVFTRFDDDTAWRIGAWLRERARANNWPLVIDIRQFHRQLFFAALPGSAPDNVDWARRKRNVVERFHRSSYGFGRELAALGLTLNQRYELSEAEYGPHGGGFPVTLAGGGVVGVITVSGLPQHEDHMLIVEALATELGLDPADYRVEAPAE